MQLRDYQQLGISAIGNAFREGHKRVCFQLPTGGGKTVVFCYLCAKWAERNATCLILVHRVELLHQTRRRLLDSRTQVHQIQTAARREILQGIRMVIVDECHHAAAKQWHDLIQRYADSGALILGVTATPWRMDGKALPFDHLVTGPQVSELQELGNLSPSRYYCPPAPKIQRKRREFTNKELADEASKPYLTGDALGHWQKYAHKLPTIAFCCSIEHCNTIAEIFMQAGYPFRTVDGSMDDATRVAILKDLAEGRIYGVCSCEVLGEGVDVPVVACVMSLRPTQSLSLWLQQVGRGLRVCEGKSETIILDHAGNVSRHGFAEDERTWSLDPADWGTLPSSRGSTCPKCFATYPGKLDECPDCGYVYLSGGDDSKAQGGREALETVEGELVEAAPVKKSERQILHGILTEYATSKGYKKGWAWHKMNERQTGRPLANGIHAAKLSGEWRILMVTDFETCAHGRYIYLENRQWRKRR